MGPKELTATAPPGFSMYASRSAAEDATVVLVLDKHAASDVETFAFSGTSGSPARGFHATFPAYSISAVTFPDGGGSPTLYLSLLGRHGELLAAHPQAGAPIAGPLPALRRG